MPASYSRKLQTQAGEVKLKVAKLRLQTFETAIIERYRGRESSVEEALIEMYLAGVSVRRVEDITEALWGTRVSPSTVSNLNKKIYASIEAWRMRPIEDEHPYLYLDGIVLKRSWAGEVRNVSLLVATSVNREGYREILGICEGGKEDGASWLAFLKQLKQLKQRGLAGVRLIVSDACLGLVEAAGEASIRKRRIVPDVRSKATVFRRDELTRQSLSATIIPPCCALVAVASDGAQMIDGSTSAIVGVQKASTATSDRTGAPASL
jgi:transposase-like protein